MGLSLHAICVSPSCSRLSVGRVGATPPCRPLRSTFNQQVRVPTIPPSLAAICRPTMSQDRMRGTWERGRPARQARGAAKMAALPGAGSPLILAPGKKGGTKQPT